MGASTVRELHRSSFRPIAFSVAVVAMSFCAACFGEESTNNVGLDAATPFDATGGDSQGHVDAGAIDTSVADSASDADASVVRDAAPDADASADAAPGADASADAALCPPSGLLAYYALDENTGNVIHDGTGNGHDGTTTATWAVGKKGFALSFDGTTSAIVPAADSFMYGDKNCDYTVEYWVNVTVGPTGQFRVVYHHGNSDMERTSGQWLDMGALDIRGSVSTTIFFNEVLVSDPVSLSTWVFVTDLKRGAVHEVWLNGVLNQMSTLGGASVGNRGPLYLGADPVWPGMSGLLDEVRVYQGAISQAQIQLDMQ